MGGEARSEIRRGGGKFSNQKKNKKGGRERERELGWKKWEIEIEGEGVVGVEWTSFPQVRIGGGRGSKISVGGREKRMRGKKMTW